MKQVMRSTANYAADLAGVNSALYELGGLIIMHDASGCNSTYATHDEPRWYSIDSMVFISGLEEYDAILGNDDKLIGDVLEAAEELQPKFIALFGSPIALVMGTDFPGIAHYIEKKTGIPCFGFQTSGMYSYVLGASQAYQGLAERFVKPMQREEKSSCVSINILGMTPLDFGYTGNKEALDAWCKEEGFSIISNWSMGSSLEDIEQASKADVNLLVSSTAWEAAKTLQEKYGIPYVMGVPMGDSLSKELANRIRQAAKDGKSWILNRVAGQGKTLLIGEAVYAASLRWALQEEYGLEDIRILCPTEIHAGILSEMDICSDEEDIAAQWINQADLVIADPLYQRVLKNAKTRFVSNPHWAYSGRMYKERMPIVIGKELTKWFDREWKEENDV